MIILSEVAILTDMVSRNNMDQWANIKFYFQLGKTFTEALELMYQVYSDDCPSHMHVFKWYASFYEVCAQSVLKTEEKILMTIQIQGVQRLITDDVTRKCMNVLLLI